MQAAGSSPGLVLCSVMPPGAPKLIPVSHDTLLASKPFSESANPVPLTGWTQTSSGKEQAAPEVT
jgi:hypothetical protein